MTMELAKDHKVFFVEQNKFGCPRIEIKKENRNLVRIIPYWPFDHRFRYRIPIQNELYQNFVFSRIKRLKIGIECNDLYIINFDHTASRIFSYFSKNKILYYCNDNFIETGRFNPWFINTYHITSENKVIQGSAFCIGTSEYLYNKLVKLNWNSHLILLGAPGDIPSKHKVFTNSQKNQQTITVTYVGFMYSSALAIDWIERCLENNKFRFIFIGPINRNIKNRFSTAKNVVFIGPKTGVNLYSILANSNVCIAPYKINDINQGGTANKLWLYLALGKPVILSKLPAMSSWKFEENLVYFTNDNKQFPYLIEEAFLRDNEELFLKRIEFARENSWTNRMNQLIELL